MAVLAIEWQISQHLDTTYWDQVMEHFLKILQDFCAYF